MNECGTHRSGGGKRQRAPQRRHRERATLGEPDKEQERRGRKIGEPADRPRRLRKEKQEDSCRPGDAREGSVSLREPAQRDRRRAERRHRKEDKHREVLPGIVQRDGLKFGDVLPVDFGVHDTEGGGEERHARRVQQGCDERREGEECRSEEPAAIGGWPEDQTRCAPAREEACSREIEEQPDEERSDGKTTAVELEPSDHEHRGGPEPDGEFTAGGAALRGGSYLLDEHQRERKEREGKKARPRCGAHGDGSKVGRSEQDRHNGSAARRERLERGRQREEEEGAEEGNACVAGDGEGPPEEEVTAEVLYAPRLPEVGEREGVRRERGAGRGGEPPRCEVPEGIGVARDPPRSDEPQQQPCDEQHPEAARGGWPRSGLRRVSFHVSCVRETGGCYRVAAVFRKPNAVAWVEFGCGPC